MEHYAQVGTANVKFFTQNANGGSIQKKIRGRRNCLERPLPTGSGKYGRTAADALSDARCGMRCADEPQLKQDEGDEQDGDTGDIPPALNQQRGLRGLARREGCRHFVISFRENPRRWAAY